MHLIAGPRGHEVAVQVVLVGQLALSRHEKGAFKVTIITIEYLIIISLVPKYMYI